MMIYKLLLIISLLSIFYVYLGYPIAITIISIFSRNKVNKKDIEPTVSLLITAFNEEKNIAAKLLNSLELDYPEDKIEIIVASDGSTDKTDDLVLKFSKEHSERKVILHRVEGRVGKTQTQNSAVKICNGEVIVFSDAASMYEKKAIRALVKNYADENVGAVSGIYNYKEKNKASVGLATIIFWKIENFIKSRQTKIKTITGCCGCIYSVKRELYEELPANIISDLVEPLMILKKGYRIVFEPNARAIEETAGKSADEFSMRIRVIIRGMIGMLYAKELYNFKKYPFVAFQLISHKVLRWFVPIFCLILFVSNVMIVFNVEYKSDIYMYLILMQLLFYGAAILGFIGEKKGISSKLLLLPLYFCIVNFAALISMFKVLKGENIVTWQTKR